MIGNCFYNHYYLGILFFNLFIFCNAGTFGNVVELACRTNPTLPMCRILTKKTKLMDNVIPSATNDETTIVAVTESHNEDSTDNINSEANMPPLSDIKEDGNLTMTDDESKMEESHSEEPKNLSPDVSSKDMIFKAASFLKSEAFESVTTESPKILSKDKSLESLKQHYCQTYIGNFTTYCHGKERFRLPEAIKNRLLAFCHSFKSTCYPMHSTPCTPDCDPRFHAHCTVSCKCHYLYPFVLKFCSPVEIHSLEDVCRSWFIKCAKIHSIDE